MKTILSKFVSKAKGFLAMGVLLAAITAPVDAADFVRGDCNDDGAVNIADVINMLGYLTLNSPVSCQKSMDADDDGEIDIVDPVYLLNVLFVGSVVEQAPFPSCGADPTPDALDCDFSVCP